MPLISQSGGDAGEWVNVRFSIEGEPVTFGVEGQPHIDTTMNATPMGISVQRDDLGIIGTVSSTGRWDRDIRSGAVDSMYAALDERQAQLHERYAAERARIEKSREKATERARCLLFEHLSEEQRSDYKEHAYFDVPSSRSPGEIFFRLIHKNVSNIHVYTRHREDAFPDGGRHLPPQAAFDVRMSEMLDRAGFWMSLLSGQSRSTRPPDSNGMRHHRTLCLVPAQHGAPIEDQLLAQKLLIETNEPTLWLTAR